MQKSKYKQLVLEARATFSDANRYEEYEFIGYFRLVKALCKKLKERKKGKIQITKFEEILSDLNERNYNILRWRYWEGQTREVVARKLSVSIERVRQLEEKVFRRMKFLVQKNSGTEKSIPIEALNLKTRGYLALKHAGINTINELCALSQYELMWIKGIGKIGLVDINRKLGLFTKKTLAIGENDFMQLPIDLLDFSIRVNTALKREGIFVIKQLFEIPIQELYSIRGIGVKCCDEIVLKKQQVIDGFSDDLKKDFISLDTRGMSTRMKRVIKETGVKTVEDFIRLKKNRVMRVWHIGETTWKEIYKKQQELKGLNA